MPTHPKRTILLEEDENYREFKRAHFQHKFAQFTGDLDLDSEGSISGKSGVSSESNVSDDSHSSSESMSFSDLEDSFINLREEMICLLRHEIETTRVLDPMPQIPKASQLHLLDQWRAVNHPNF